ncbi:uncharacterized protein LOC144154763 [Haemaphysalis longicornis]
MARCSASNSALRRLEATEGPFASRFRVLALLLSPAQAAAAPQYSGAVQPTGPLPLSRQAQPRSASRPDFWTSGACWEVVPADYEFPAACAGRPPGAAATVTASSASECLASGFLHLRRMLGSGSGRPRAFCCLCWPSARQALVRLFYS